MFLKYFLLSATMSLAVAAYASPHDHAHSVKHNMILTGVEEVFASHIVYKSPHNYQVIAKVEFSSEVRALYRAERVSHPEETFILLLDPMNISTITSARELSGELIRKNANGVKVSISSVHLSANQFKIEYFNELPLSLAVESTASIPSVNSGTAPNNKLRVSSRGFEGDGLDHRDLVEAQLINEAKAYCMRMQPFLSNKKLEITTFSGMGEGEFVLTLTANVSCLKN